MHAVAAALGALTVAGLYADGWAHINLGGLESFFTPWHGLLYASFSLLAGWIVLAVRRGRRGGSSWRESTPRGYGSGLVGIGLFAVGGLLDMLWHIAFGVEAGIDALISPTHLLLLGGGTLLVLSPARAWWLGDGDAVPWPAVVSAATATALAGFFISYVSVFASPLAVFRLMSLPEGSPGHQAAELRPSQGWAATSSPRCSSWFPR